MALSGFVALTLTPAMCGVLLKHQPPPQRGFFAWFNRWFARFTEGFGQAVLLVIKRMTVAFVLLAVLVAAIVHLFRCSPRASSPTKTRGT